MENIFQISPPLFTRKQTPPLLQAHTLTSQQQRDIISSCNYCAGITGTMGCLHISLQSPSTGELCAVGSGNLKMCLYKQN